MKAVLVLVAMLIGSSVDIAQIVEDDCPVINVYGPAGIPATDDPAHFIVRIDTKRRDIQLGYHWTTYSPAKIVKGQGTAEIDVVPVYSGVTVTVEVSGLPSGCPTSSSEMLEWLIEPKPELLDQFVGRLSRVPDPRFRDIARKALDQPYAQIYVFIPDPMTGAEAFQQKREIVRRKLVSKSVDESRLTFVHTDGVDAPVLVWLVPPGATPPSP